MPGRYIDPVKELAELLLTVEKPARYTGGEIGCLAEKDKPFRSLIAFPDLYEIGMGNQALRIIYNQMNKIPGVSCDRAFAPAPDFEKLLREKKIPLYGLDTGIALYDLDLLMFTIGYELGLNGVLTMLDVSGIPLRSYDRKKDQPQSSHRTLRNKEENELNPLNSFSSSSVSSAVNSYSNGYPVIIAGGPAVSNPLPFSPFIDAFWLGEAEAGFFELASELAQMKKNGEGREALLKKIASHPNVWVKGKSKAARAVFSGFSASGEAAVFPIPSMKIVQHHGSAEIMRGCPNGCRFCHAGFWYRPVRQRDSEIIINHVNEMVTKGGWQEISLSSLSSGDYEGINELIDKLNQKFQDRHISFQLPSLKVSGFSLDLLEKISVIRKSSLTFAVETPNEARQMSINKEVTRDSAAAILQEAKKRGWGKAKFYFMIGLFEEEESEEEEIVSFITEIGCRTRMKFNINVGIFIPKAHTPYQWAVQIDSKTAERKLNFIRAKLKPLGHKVSISDPLISRIEGLLSRGDERAGFMCEEAFLGGSRLDAWDEYINREKWTEILEKNREAVDSILSGKSGLPWEGVDSCVSGKFLLKELEKSNKAERTPSCKERCSLCGACPAPKFLGAGLGKEDNIVNQREIIVNKEEKRTDPSIYRVLFSFSKLGSAVFHGHLSLIEIFSMSFRRAGIPVLYTQGFNPIAKMEFASPLSTGIGAEAEIASVDFAGEVSAEDFKDGLNKCLPEGIRIQKAEGYLIKSGSKKHSLSSLLWGFAYANNGKHDYVNRTRDKVYKQSRLESDCASVFCLTRTSVLAKNLINEKGEYASYFDVYRHFYSA